MSAAVAAQHACRIAAKKSAKIGGRSTPWPAWLDSTARRQRRQCGSAVSGAAPAVEQPPQQQEQEKQQKQRQIASQGHQKRKPERLFEEIMQNSRLTRIALELAGQVIRPGDIVVDATCGNGIDTVFLAKAVGPGGTVHAFDVQAAAIAAAQQHVSSSLPEGQVPAVHYHLASHADMLQHVPANSARAVVFNLGYLPGSDRATTTQQSSTLPAVEAACEVLRPGGLCSILCYTGHEGGVEEYEAVQALVKDLPPSRWVSSEIRLLNRPGAPLLLLVWKRT